jgi:hypothetical protein
MFFLGLALFKGQFNMTVTLFSNLHNGFSGEQMYRDNYYSLFNTFHTPWPLLFFLWMDQDVSYNGGSIGKVDGGDNEYEPANDYECCGCLCKCGTSIQYSKEPLEQKDLPDYDPNSFHRNMHFGDRGEILKQKGIAFNSDPNDGST